MIEQKSAAERRLQRRALQTLKEWLSSERFRERAQFETAWAETSLAKEIERRRREDWQWWADDDGRRLKELCLDIQRTWVESGWVRLETRTVGRPRVAEHPTEVLNKARRIYNEGVQGYRADSSYRWAESILGESVGNRTTKLIVIHESIHRELLEAVGEENIEGLSRLEVATVVGLSKPYTNRFVRWLVSTGKWREVRTRDVESRERVLRRAA